MGYLFTELLLSLLQFYCQACGKGDWGIFCLMCQNDPGDRLSTPWHGVIGHSSSGRKNTLGLVWCNGRYREKKTQSKFYALQLQIQLIPASLPVTAHRTGIIGRLEKRDLKILGNADSVAFSVLLGTPLLSRRQQDSLRTCNCKLDSINCTGPEEKEASVFSETSWITVINTQCTRFPLQI